MLCSTRGALLRFACRALSTSSTAPRICTLPSPDTPGLFGLPGLHNARDWHHLAEDCLRRSAALVARFGQRPADSKLVLQDFDDLSETLCRVLDSAELCRNVHPDPHYVRAANEAISRVSSYMQELNTNVQLYDSIVRLAKSGAELSEEEVQMVASLWRDFEASGIHLPTQGRSRAVQLQNEIQNLGAEFIYNLHQDESRTLSVPAERLHAVSVALTSRLRRSANGRMVELPLTPHVVNNAMKWISDSNTRRTIHHASVCLKNSQVLEKLLRTRHELAQLAGFADYATMSLSDRMASSTLYVHRFLERLSGLVLERADHETSMMKAVKARNEGFKDGVVDIYPWDRTMYMSRVRSTHSFGGAQGEASEYFALAACVSGLAMIMREVFDVHMVATHAHPGEVWHPSVTKMELRGGNNEVLGHIYMDLFARFGKYNQAAHFTVRCGRDPGGGEPYQTPIVALVCNFSATENDASPLLSHVELETLFHEFGHAMHSILARTRFQNLSGTRGSIDFVEIPSNLFEYFARDYRVLSRFAIDTKSGNAISMEEVRAILNDRNLFAGVELQQQILLSSLDLEYHSARGTDDMDAVYTRLADKFTNIKRNSEVPQQSKFSHLVGYSAGYYSYLFAKVLAAEIWQQLFVAQPLSRRSGDRLRNNMLRYGGGRSGRKLVGSLVERPSLISCLSDHGIVEATGAELANLCEQNPFRF